MAADAPDLVAYIVRTLAEHPDQVEVTDQARGNQHVIMLKVAPDDLGRVIGRDGRVANAIRTLLGAVDDSGRWRLEIVD